MRILKLVPFVEEVGDCDAGELFQEQIVEDQFPLGQRGHIPNYLEAAE